MQIKRVEPVYRVSTSIKYNRSREECKKDFKESLNQKMKQDKKGKR